MYSEDNGIGVAVYQILVCVTLWHMSISSGIVIAVALQEVDDTPNAETGTECDYEGLKNGDCLSKKCHK